MSYAKSVQYNPSEREDSWQQKAEVCEQRASKHSQLVKTATSL